MIQIVLTSLFITTLVVVAQNEQVSIRPASLVNSAEEDEARSFGSGDLSVSASDSSTLTTRSHKILATGWPSTSQMWPSIHMANHEHQGNMENSTRWFEMIEPFIYADKPRSNDYSLLLTINKTVLDILKSHSKPIVVDLSFEYYFSYDQRITAPPGMRIEVDRKQLKYLEPNGQSIRPNVWIKMNEKIPISESARLDNTDWLKISLVNRQTPSLVALRHLRVEFILEANGQSMVDQPPSMVDKQGDIMNNSPGIQNQQDEQPSQRDQPMTPLPLPPPVINDDSHNKIPPNQQPPIIDPPLPSQPPAPVQPIAQPQPPIVPMQPPISPSGQTQAGEFPNKLPPDSEIVPQQDEPSIPEQTPELVRPQEETPADFTGPPQNRPLPPQYDKPIETTDLGDQVPASSNDIKTKVKPEEKKSRWSIWGKGRRKRDTSSLISQQTNQTISNQLPKSIVLTCFRADACHWKTESSEQIQWSLARMPPSTNMVQSGYYYVSNRNNYGDSSRMLHLWLNQTDSATIADQNSDHCIELALYVTEGSYLNLYQLKRSSTANDEVWQRGNKLLSWSPTLATPAAISNGTHISRTSVPKSRLMAMINGHNGWTFEHLCYGDFFANDLKDCAIGLCAFGFEMESPKNHQQDAGLQPSNSVVSEQSKEMISGELTSEESSPGIDEQVVGVAVLQEYTVNVALGRRTNWLETWQRDQVEPGDDWKFYPRLDYYINPNNISLMNMFDHAHYYIESNWLRVDNHLSFLATLAIEPMASNETLIKIPDLHDQLASSSNQIGDTTGDHESDDIYVFALTMITKLADANYNLIFSNTSIFNWPLRNNETHLIDLSLPVTDRIFAAHQDHLQRDSSLYKIILEFVFDTHWISSNSSLEKLLIDNDLTYRLSLANISLSDRCFPNPCPYGTCQQNGTGLEDWICQCDEQHRGRHCEFGRWCNLPHITPWNPANNNNNNNNNKNQITLRAPQSIQQRQPKVDSSTARVSGKEYCQRKLGAGSRCTDIDLPLNDNLYTEEDRTFVCSCQDDYYLSDDSKCKSAHLCNSVVCPSIGMVCDESKPFNRTQPCHCDEKQDWFPDPMSANKCIRRQCHDKQRDCQFDAHICLPTLPGEKPICKCGPKFTLKVEQNHNGNHKYCQSTACVLPTLNDCQQICLPDNENLSKPYTCACHPGYTLDPDGRTCRPQRPHSPPHCKPACHSDTQICTDAGCRCKQGYVGEGEVRVQQVPKNKQISNSTIEYTQSIRCLNVCSLTYAENKDEFERIESVCPLGLCDPTDFQCRCADPSSSALINTKYEPIYDNSTTLQRTSPLCHLKRVCEADSSGHKICRSRGAICVPDYTKAAMFDCVCPPSTEKRKYGQETVSEFTCEPKCSTKRSECLRRQAICKLVDRDEVRCECLPGLMFDQHDQKCYLAKYSYSFNLLVVNRYYEPEAKFHKLEPLNSTLNLGDTSKSGRLFEIQRNGNRATNHLVDGSEFNEIIPQFNSNENQVTSPENHQHHPLRSIFITEYNQCNITQVIPKSVIDDPYEHDIESYLGYIDQCNEKIHQNVRTYHLNSRLSEELRQSLRQHLRDFTVTTNNNSCSETDPSGMYLNCTVYLQSNEPVPMSTVDFVLNDCDKHGQDERYCWIKPRLLLKKPETILNQSDTNTTAKEIKNKLNFQQIIPCEINNFCGQDAYSVRIDDKTSLCSCKCPLDIEAIDVKDLQPRNENEAARVSVKEICAPRNLCGNNSTLCLGKAGSVCQYDIRTGSKCICVYPSYEDSEGRCVEITYSPLNSTLIVIIIMLGTGLIVSIGINLAVVAKSKSVFGRSKQYPLNEFSSARPTSRSTGVPNPVFTND